MKFKELEPGMVVKQHENFLTVISVARSVDPHVTTILWMSDVVYERTYWNEHVISFFDMKFVK